MSKEEILEIAQAMRHIGLAGVVETEKALLKKFKESPQNVPILNQERWNAGMARYRREKKNGEQKYSGHKIHGIAGDFVLPTPLLDSQDLLRHSFGIQANLRNMQQEILKENLRYCLYARKSTESDEKQAMSIESQVKEMLQVAEREGIKVVEIKREAHSAKATGQRPEFNKMIDELMMGRFNAILTWAPDRLSRNAGDLGILVDFLDQKVIVEIRTFSQRFTNNPNEKFLLMILGAQGKLENDQKGLNVKRGLRAIM